jgi:hypothetical protein
MSEWASWAIELLACQVSDGEQLRTSFSAAHTP